MDALLLESLFGEASTPMMAPQPDSSAAQEPAVRFTDVTKRTKAGDAAVSRVSFDVSGGEVYAILGGPKAGKTTIADLALGLEVPTAGAIEICGVQPNRFPVRARQLISFVDSRRGIDETLNAVANVVLFASLSHCVGVTKPHVVNALRLAGVPDKYLSVKIREAPSEVALSTALAIGLVRSTPVLVVDDPTVGLDSRAIDCFCEAMNIFRERGTAILMTTSDVLLAGQLANRIGILKGGQLLAEQRRPQLIGQSLTEFAEQYIGKPRTLTPLLSGTHDVWRSR